MGPRDRVVQHRYDEGSRSVSDPFDIKALRIDPTKFSTPYVPAKLLARADEVIE